MFCDACDKGFHMECLSPPMTETPTGMILVQLAIFKCFLEGGFSSTVFSVFSFADQRPSVNQFSKIKLLLVGSLRRVLLEFKEPTY